MTFMGVKLNEAEPGIWRNKFGPDAPFVCIGCAVDGSWFGQIRCSRSSIKVHNAPSRRAAAERLRKCVVRLRADLAVFK
jgi:hypothetical protein